VLALVAMLEDGAPVVRVLPITHTPPARTTRRSKSRRRPRAASARFTIESSSNVTGGFSVANERPFDQQFVIALHAYAKAAAHRSSTG
jgi:hypothetical protein